MTFTLSLESSRKLFLARTLYDQKKSNPFSVPLFLALSLTQRTVITW